MAGLSIIIPVLDEAPRIERTLSALAPLRRRGVELIVVDGGSRDSTVALAFRHADVVLPAPRGRAAQMRAGARVARGDVLLFLHADTTLPEDADSLVLEGLARSRRAWGRFDVHIDGRHWLLPLVRTMMNWRSRLTGIATGDQAIFVTREAFDAVGGMPPLPLMEDIELSRRLKWVGRPLCLREKVVTSGRRWDEHGAIRTILLMWRLRLAFFFGADPADLAERYGRRRR